MMQKSKI